MPGGMKNAKLEIALSTLFLLSGGVVFFVLGDRPAQAQRYVCVDFVRNRTYFSNQDQTTAGDLGITCQSRQAIAQTLPNGGYFCVDYGRNTTFTSTLDATTSGSFGIQCLPVEGSGTSGSGTRPGSSGGVSALW